MDIQLLRVDDVSHLLGISRAHTYQLVADGTLPSIKLGKSRRVPRAALEAWLQEQLTPPADPGLEADPPEA